MKRIVHIVNGVMSKISIARASRPRVSITVSDFRRDPKAPKAEVTYFFETQVAFRGLPLLVHEQTLRHYCAQPVNEEQFKARYGGSENGAYHNSLPLFTNFLLDRIGPDGKVRYMLRIALFVQRYQEGFLLFGDHLERLPLWSDYLVVELRERLEHGGMAPYDVRYAWASDSIEPNTPMPISRGENGATILLVPLLPGKAQSLLGSDAVTRFEASAWN
jgi:hypothetical protein